MNKPSKEKPESSLRKLAMQTNETTFDFERTGEEEEGLYSKRWNNVSTMCHHLFHIFLESKKLQKIGKKVVPLLYSFNPQNCIAAAWETQCSSGWPNIKCFVKFTELNRIIYQTESHGLLDFQSSISVLS